MKTTKVIILILVVILVFTGCTQLNLKPQTTEVSEIIDFTDKMIATPKPDNVNALFNLNNNKWSGGVFRLLYITNVSYNPMSGAKIEAENEWLSNQFQRAEKVKMFYTEITKIISDISKEDVGKDNSAVYFPVAKELNRLSQSTANKKILLIHSDLMENTTGMSFYDKQTLSLLKTNSDSIKKYFESQMELKKMDGIKIYLIYQPINIREDEDYKVVSNFYKNLFESKGAEVEITASLN